MSAMLSWWEARGMNVGNAPDSSCIARSVSWTAARYSTVEHLGQRIAGGDERAEASPGLVVRHGVGALVPGLQARERAEHAAGHADIGGVDVQVAIEVGAVAMQALAHLVRQRPHLQQVGV